MKVSRKIEILVFNFGVCQNLEKKNYFLKNYAIRGTLIFREARQLVPQISTKVSLTTFFEE